MYLGNIQELSEEYVFIRYQMTECNKKEVLGVCIVTQMTSRFIAVIPRRQT